MSLTTSHLMFVAFGTDPFQTNESICQAAPIFGCFRTVYLYRHWVKENPVGYCILCTHLKLQYTVDHFLVSCSSLGQTSEKVIIHILSIILLQRLQLHNLLEVELCSPTPTLLQFLINPWVASDCMQGAGCSAKVIKTDYVCSVTKPWCYALQRLKLQLTGKFRKIWLVYLLVDQTFPC